MDNQQLFTAALGLSDPWKVVDLVFSPGNQERRGSLTIQLDFEAGSRFADPTHDPEQGGEPALCPVHDTVEKRWRHLDFFQHDTTLVARVPRVRTPEGRTVLAKVPWARPGSGFTLLMEAVVLAFCRDMPVARVAELLGEHDTRLWRVLIHHVEATLENTSWEGALDCVAIDETSIARGHTYSTGVVALEKTGDGEEEDAPRRARLLFLAEGRKASQVGEFAEECRRRGHDPGTEVREAAIDMSKAYIKGVAEHLPGASVCFDRFHVMAMAGKAVDAVRKTAAKACGGLPRGSLWALRGSQERLSEEQRDLRSELCRAHGTIARAMAMKEYLATL